MAPFAWQSNKAPLFSFTQNSCLGVSIPLRWTEAEFWQHWPLLFTVASLPVCLLEPPGAAGTWFLGRMGLPLLHTPHPVGLEPAIPDLYAGTGVGAGGKERWWNFRYSGIFPEPASTCPSIYLRLQLLSLHSGGREARRPGSLTSAAVLFPQFVVL